MTLIETVRAAYPHRSQFEPDSGIVVARIDDRELGDCFPAFCEVVAAVRPDGTCTLTLTHPPLNDGVRAVVEDYEGRVTCTPLPAIRVELPGSGDAIGVVHDLAAAIKGVTRRGQRYPEKNWVWIAPRTARSLSKFASLLTRHYRLSRGPASRRSNSPA